jgi:hypothetical protein
MSASRSWAVTHEARDGREKRDPKFEVQGSKFQKPRTSDLEPSSVLPVSRGYPAGVFSEYPLYWGPVENGKVRVTLQNRVLYDTPHD